MTLDNLCELLAPSTTGYFVTLAELIYFEGATAKSWYICNNTEPLSIDGVTYEAVAFKYVEPNITESGISSASIAIDAVSQISPSIALKTTRQPLLVVKGLFIPENGLFEKLNDWTYLIDKASWTATSLTAELVLESSLEKLMPYDRVDIEGFPACY